MKREVDVKAHRRVKKSGKVVQVQRYKREETKRPLRLGSMLLGGAATATVLGGGYLALKNRAAIGNLFRRSGKKVVDVQKTNADGVISTVVSEPAVKSVDVQKPLPNLVDLKTPEAPAVVDVPDIPLPALDIKTKVPIQYVDRNGRQVKIDFDLDIPKNPEYGKPGVKGNRAFDDLYEELLVNRDKNQEALQTLTEIANNRNAVGRFRVQQMVPSREDSFTESYRTLNPREVRTSAVRNRRSYVKKEDLRKLYVDANAQSLRLSPKELSRLNIPENKKVLADGLVQAQESIKGIEQRASRITLPGLDKYLILKQNPSISGAGDTVLNQALLLSDPLLATRRAAQIREQLIHKIAEAVTEADGIKLRFTGEQYVKASPHVVKYRKLKSDSDKLRENLYSVQKRVESLGLRLKEASADAFETQKIRSEISANLDIIRNGRKALESNQAKINDLQVQLERILGNPSIEDAVDGIERYRKKIYNLVGKDLKTYEDTIRRIDFLDNVGQTDSIEYDRLARKMSESSEAINAIRQKLQRSGNEKLLTQLESVFHYEDVAVKLAQFVSEFKRDPAFAKYLLDNKFFLMRDASGLLTPSVRAQFYGVPSSVLTRVLGSKDELGGASDMLGRRVMRLDKYGVSTTYSAARPSYFSLRYPELSEFARSLA